MIKYPDGNLKNLINTSFQHAKAGGKVQFEKYL